MPTYTYECKKCGWTTDKFHAMSASPRVHCDECGGTCKRLLGTGAGIIFKGSGFYETDYKTKSGTPEKTESGKDGGGKGKSESKKDSASSKESSGGAKSGTKSDDK